MFRACRVQGFEGSAGLGFRGPPVDGVGSGAVG